MQQRIRIVLYQWSVTRAAGKCCVKPYMLLRKRMTTIYAPLVRLEERLTIPILFAIPVSFVHSTLLRKPVSDLHMAYPCQS